MEPPIIIFEGPDATGKTTQALLLGRVLQVEHRRVAYFSFPVYEFPMGRTIGRCLGRWGETEKLPLPSPEDMALMFALNRLEALPFLKTLIERNYDLIWNRGPYSNVLNMARRVLVSGLNWGEMSSKEKSRLVSAFTGRDEVLLKALAGREMRNIFLLLDPKESMELVAERAQRISTISVDEYEKSLEIQATAALIYRDIAEGRVPGHKAEKVEAVRGGIGRLRNPSLEPKEQLSELNGILETAHRVFETYCRMIGRDFTSFWGEHVSDIGLNAMEIYRSGQVEGSVDFEFRRILGLSEGDTPDIFSLRPDFMEFVYREKPAIKDAIEGSRQMDEMTRRGKEQENGCCGNPERI